jgi:hypothetical protein
MADSKAMWRDIDVLSALDAKLEKRGQSAVLLALSTELPRRPIEQILQMEKKWDWPLAHREGEPDLTAGEARYYQHVQAFNGRARNIRIVYVNQVGFGRDSCGRRVPKDVELLDLRRGSDVEFGLSLYEPFGISPLETLTYGGICLVSTSCGCTGFVRQIVGRKRSRNIILANYIDGVVRPRALKDATAIGDAERREVEQTLAGQLADELLARLPKNESEQQRLIEAGHELAGQMSWDVVAEQSIFPAIRRAMARGLLLNVA